MIAEILASKKWLYAERYYFESLAEAIDSDPARTTSMWAQEHRVLSSKSGSESGPWRNELTPYLVEIMDVLSPASPVQEVVFIKGAQIGGTEAGVNWLGFIMDCAPAPIIMVQPNLEQAKRNSKQRIAPLIELCPRLKNKVSKQRGWDSGNNLIEKDFPGGRLVITGAQSSNGLRSMPAKYLFLDECDGYPAEIDEQGDPISLAIARTRTFKDKKIYMVSTPTVEGRSRIQMAYDRSDQRRYFVPCPLCHSYQTLRWGQLQWPDGRPEDVVYVCEHCNKPFEEHHKTQMLAAGEWRAEKPGARAGRIAGFHINSLYSPLGWDSWRNLVEQWLDAQKSPDQLRSFINTVLGETWKESLIVPDHVRLYERRETYPTNQIPLESGVLFLTAGVDVQGDRIEVEIVGWGEDKQSWSIDYRVFQGNPSTDEPWKGLDHLLSTRWRYRDQEIYIVRMAIDSGHATQMVYSWARKKSSRRVMAVKGDDNATQVLGQPKAVDVLTNGVKFNNGLLYWPVGVSQLKQTLYGYLNLDKPIDNQPYPAGYCHFPQYNLDYFKQLTSEVMVERVSRGKRNYIFEKKGRNEALDCRVYAHAAAINYGLDIRTPEEWLEIKKDLGMVPNSKNTH